MLPACVPISGAAQAQTCSHTEAPLALSSNFEV
jgi:hypothetical protein